MTSKPANAGCREVEQACAATVKAADEYIAELNIRINFLEQESRIQDDVINKLKEQHELDKQGQAAWYRQPVTMTALGFIAGALTVSYIRR